MKKAFWSRFKHFGRLLPKIYLFPTPGKTNERVPSQQGAPTTCNLSYWEVSQFGCDHTAKFNPSVLGEGVGRNGCGLKAKFNYSVWRGGYVSDKRHMPVILDAKSPTTPWIVHFPATLSLERHINFSKSSSQQKVARRTDISRNRSIGCPWRHTET